MENYYLTSLDVGEVGLLLAEKDGKISEMDPISDISIKNLELIELSKEEFDYLKKKDKKVRIKIDKEGLFSRIKSLKVNEEYSINQVRCVVTEIKANTYKIMEEDGNTKSVSILDIESVEKIDYFICMERYRLIDEGTIIVDECGKKAIFPGGELVCVGYQILKKISIEEAYLLSKFPLKERMKSWKMNNLKVGDRCRIRERHEDKYFIKSINDTEMGRVYTLRSRNREDIDVDQTMILPLMEADQKPNYEETQLCESNNVFVLDTTNIKSCHVSSVENKMICFKSNGKKIVALLKWIGEVNEQRVLGCEMRNNTIYGTDGRFGGEILFKCEYGRGVLVLAEKVEECCVKGRHKDLKRDHYGRIRGSSVCCVERVEQIKERPELKEGERVMNIWDKKIFGICRWKGLVNCREVLGVEVVQGCDEEKDGWIDQLDLFECASNKRGLFMVEDFSLDSIGLRHCAQNDVLIIDVDYIKSVSGEKIQKTMMCNSGIMNLKWKGQVNGAPCVGSEMTNQSDFGTDGLFGRRRLFECLPGTGVLIPEDELEGSCQGRGHKIITFYDTGAINPESICCVETLKNLNLWSNMRIGDKIKRIVVGKLFGAVEKTGKCKWMGLVNGIESVGVRMSDSIKYGTKGTFSFATLFKTKESKGALFLSEDIDHDINGEALKFIVDKIVDVRYAWNVKKDNTNNINGIKIGDYVTTIVNERDGRKTRLSGILKWIGTIMKKKCVGIDLKEEYEFGMDGRITNKCGFECSPRHGLVTNGEIEKGKPELKMNSDGSVNADQYLICSERWDQIILREKKAYKDGPVFLSIEKNGERRKMKGTLKWSGTMNDEFIAVVELEHEYENGTDGRFWRQQIIRCGDKRALGVSWEDINTLYEERPVPLDQRKFKEIDINSPVICYIPINNMLKNLYGTVKWSGENEFGEYYYGIELDEPYKNGTDGEFNGKRLFYCQNGHGILASLRNVAPDVRFKETDYEISKSEVCEEVQYSIPAKTFRGPNYGIQGMGNSSFFDSSIFALFSKSDVLDYIISSKINEVEKDEITKKLRKTLLWKIIYPLRKNGFVSFHHMKELKETINFEEIMKNKTDLEKLSSLLSKLCLKDKFINLKTFDGVINCHMFLQVYFVLFKKYISTQQMLDLSMAQNDIMFDKPPTCLIMQAPRVNEGLPCYENILPSKTIEISKLCSSYLKKCKMCSSKAKFQCKECVKYSLRIRDGLFCNKHKCNHRDFLKFPDESLLSTSEVQMNLKAIICIERDHYVTYVKEDELKQEWIFFDSMSSKNISNNHAVPNVSMVRSVSHFLTMDERSMEDEITSFMNESLKRIVNDSCIFVYHNSAQTCY